MPSSDQPSDKLDNLLAKYVSVWLWSIIFGATTGVLYSFLSFRFDRWGVLALALVIPAIASLLSALMSWRHVYVAMVDYLLPKFVYESARDLDPKQFAYQLSRAFQYFMFAAGFRALAAFMEIAFASTSSIG